MGKAKRKNDGSAPESLTPLLNPLRSLLNLLGRFDNRGVIIGGLAASLLGTPRYTVDLDAVFLLSVEDLPLLLREASLQGIEPRITSPIEFARRSRVLLLRHVASSIDIDISLGVLPFEVEMVERSTVLDVGAVKIHLPTPEDLIILKAVANRPKDLADIQAIAASHLHLDKERIRYWLEQFGEALDAPELWHSIQKLL